MRQASWHFPLRSTKMPDTTAGTGEADTSNLLRNAFTASIGKVFWDVASRSLTLLLSILLARNLGAQGYGIYAVAWYVAWMLAQVTDLGTAHRDAPLARENVGAASLSSLLPRNRRGTIWLVCTSSRRARSASFLTPPTLSSGRAPTRAALRRSPGVIGCRSPTSSMWEPSSRGRI